MTIEQLQYFYAVTIHQTFSQAAAEMNITQSALSKQIAKLEQELGVFLFNRSHRQITLTNAGKQFLKDTEILLADYQKMIENQYTLKTNHKNTLKIAMLPIFSQYDLAHKLNDFSKKHPSIHLVIDEIEERDLQYKLDYHDYDIYILRGNYHALDSFQYILLYEDELVAVISKQHPLSHLKQLSIQQLKTEKLLLPPKYTNISDLVIEACHQNHFNPYIHRHGRIETILSAASENEGIALVMKKSLHIFHLNQVLVLPFQEHIQGNIFMYYSLDSLHKDIIQEFIQAIRPVQ
ncbi:LysR family transcriptional regulator [Amedibacterium intestinale]|uniref:LysR family transcriptional regulator n=1 Tax=Amedibacterium intestinale TaxID=2583452 RepID=UPI003991C3E9